MCQTASHSTGFIIVFTATCFRSVSQNMWPWINKKKIMLCCDCVNTYTCDTLTPIGMAHRRIKGAAFS